MKEIFTFKVGLFGIGLEAYRAQFEDLENRLKKYISIVEEKIAGYECQVVNMD